MVYHISLNPRTTKLFTVSNKLTQGGGGGGLLGPPIDFPNG